MADDMEDWEAVLAGRRDGRDEIASEREAQRLRAAILRARDAAKSTQPPPVAQVAARWQQAITEASTSPDAAVTPGIGRRPFAFAAAAAVLLALGVWWLSDPLLRVHRSASFDDYPRVRDGAPPVLGEARVALDTLRSAIEWLRANELPYSLTRTPNGDWRLDYLIPSPLSASALASAPPDLATKVNQWHTVLSVP